MAEQVKKEQAPPMAVKGGGMRGGPRVVGKVGKPDKATVKRLLGYIFKDYKFHFVLVIICIICNSLAGVAGSLFLQTLIDKYITPLIGTEIPDFTPLLRALCVMGVIYLVGMF